MSTFRVVLALDVAAEDEDEASEQAAQEISEWDSEDVLRHIASVLEAVP